MRPRWPAVVLLVLAFLLSGMLFAVWPDVTVEPDLVAAVVVAVALEGGSELATVLGVSGGLAIDLTLGRFIGLHAVSLALLAWLAGRLRRPLYTETWTLSLTIASIALLAKNLGQYLVLRVGGVPVAPFTHGVVLATLETLPFFVLAKLVLGAVAARAPSRPFG